MASASWLFGIRRNRISLLSPVYKVKGNRGDKREKKASSCGRIDDVLRHLPVGINALQQVGNVRIVQVCAAKFLQHPPVPIGANAVTPAVPDAEEKPRKRGEQK